jgi:hypothetical protein
MRFLDAASRSGATRNHSDSFYHHRTGPYFAPAPLAAGAMERRETDHA